jgi:hypothetical protein
MKLLKQFCAARAGVTLVTLLLVTSGSAVADGTLCRLTTTAGNLPDSFAVLVAGKWNFAATLRPAR